MRSFNLLLLAFALLGLMAACSADDASDTQDTVEDFRDILDGFPTPNTPTALEAERERIAGLGESATYRVVYRRTLDLGGDPVSGTDTVYRRGSVMFREDSVSSTGDRTQHFASNGAVIVCGYFDEPNCMAEADARAALQQSIDQLVLEVPPFNNRPFPVDRPERTAVPTFEAKESRYDREILGEPTTCFLDRNASWESIQCYTKDGILLYSRSDYGGSTYVEEAQEFSRIVADADFDLPYPVIVPTPLPQKPISPLQ